MSIRVYKRSNKQLILFPRKTTTKKPNLDQDRSEVVHHLTQFVQPRCFCRSPNPIQGPATLFVLSTGCCRPVEDTAAPLSTAQSAVYGSKKPTLLLPASPTFKQNCFWYAPGGPSQRFWMRFCCNGQFAQNRSTQYLKIPYPLSGPHSR